MAFFLIWLFMKRFQSAVLYLIIMEMIIVREGIFCCWFCLTARFFWSVVNLIVETVQWWNCALEEWILENLKRYFLKELLLFFQLDFLWYLSRVFYNFPSQLDWGFLRLSFQLVSFSKWASNMYLMTENIQSDGIN